MKNHISNTVFDEVIELTAFIIISSLCSQYYSHCKPRNKTMKKLHCFQQLPWNSTAAQRCAHKIHKSQMGTVAIVPSDFSEKKAEGKAKCVSPQQHFTVRESRQCRLEFSLVHTIYWMKFCILVSSPEKIPFSWTFCLEISAFVQIITRGTSSSQGS